MSNNQPPFPADPGTPRLRPLRAPALAGLQQALAARASAAARLDTAVDTSRAAENWRDVLAKDPVLLNGHALAAAAAHAAARCRRVEADRDLEHADAVEGDAFALALSDLMGETGWTPMLPGGEYYFVNRHLRPWLPAAKPGGHDLGRTQAYRLPFRPEAGTWDDVVITARMPHGRGTDALLCAVDDREGCPFNADRLPWAWQSRGAIEGFPDLVLFYGRRFGRAGVPSPRT